ncbi:TRAP transporter substrate-binding protein [Ammoniphilus sp. CFH 90114]|uniref:TRAP transporter substrate-binding protein n=1 Tax=Ammoniphilus sp. CFH 90114 TaxID=2493665 RepID=UPI00100FFD04|nr:TRAP transporter substrate-binding protein [Ammoniphilus sp. CFH 90114]RXT07029.1 TRAP transporter substrate-binding protein [Ammoniphilus sp. CFH 90114]
MRKGRILATIVVAFSVLAAGCGGSKPETTGQTNVQEAAPESKETNPITIKLAHTNSATDRDPYHAVALKFKEIMEKNEKVKVEIFPGGQLGGEQRAFQDMQNGIIQATVLASNNASVFAPSLSVLDLPFLFKSNDEFKKVITELDGKFTDIMIKESDTRPIAWGVQGFRVLSNSKKPVEKMEDLKGIKIRVPNNPVQVSTFKAWNSEPVAMGFDELFGALQQKVVDGMEMTYVGIAQQKFYEVQSYVTDLRYKLAINPLVVSETWFQSLPQDVQEEILAAGKEITEHAFSIAEELEKEGKDILTEKGVQLSGRPVDEEVWVQEAMKVWPDVYPLIKDPTILDEVLKVLDIEKP